MTTASWLTAREFQDANAYHLSPPPPSTQTSVTSLPWDGQLPAYKPRDYRVSRKACHIELLTFLPLAPRLQRGIFLDLIFFMYIIQHCFICHPSDSTLLEDAGIKPRAVVTLALAVRLSNARSHLPFFFLRNSTNQNSANQNLT